MASYNELNALIDAYINRNGVQAITGQILNGVLKAIVEQIGRGYAIMGVADLATDPGTPDAPESWFASTPGTYTNFGGLVVADAEFAIFSYTPQTETWEKTTLTEGIAQVSATIDGNVGTPSVGVSYANGVLSFDFHNMKGNPGQNGQDGQDGDPAGFGTIDADITGGVGTPGVTVESSGPATAKNLQFHFTNLKGETGVTSVVATVDNTTGTPTCTVSLVGQQLTLAFSGLKGAQGDTGSSVDYPFTIVNNLTTDDATQALSAAQGVVLQGEITQLEHKVDENANIDFPQYVGWMSDNSGAYTSASNNSFIIIPIRGGVYYEFVANDTPCHLCFLKTFTGIPSTSFDNTGNRIVLASVGAKVSGRVPSNANFLYVLRKYQNTLIDLPTIYINGVDVSKAIVEQTAQLAKNAVLLQNELRDYLVRYPGWMSADSGTYNSNNQFIVIPIAEGVPYEFEAKETPCHLAFLNSFNGVPSSSFDINGTRIILTSVGAKVSGTVPTGAKFIYILSRYSGADITLPVIKVAEINILDKVIDQIYALASFTRQFAAIKYENGYTEQMLASNANAYYINANSSYPSPFPVTSDTIKTTNPIWLRKGDAIRVISPAMGGDKPVLCKASSSVFLTSKYQAIDITPTGSGYDTTYDYTIVDEGYYVISWSANYASAKAYIIYSSHNAIDDNTNHIATLSKKVDKLDNIGAIVNVFGDVLPKSFKTKFFNSENDVEIVCVGDSLTGLTQYCDEYDEPEHLAPGLDTAHWTSLLFRRLCYNPPVYDRSDSQREGVDVFTKVGTWVDAPTTDTGDYGNYSQSANTFKSASQPASASFALDLDEYEKATIVFSMSPDGCDTEIVVAEGNGKLLASLDKTTWVEANGFSVLQTTADMQERHRRVWMKKVVGATGEINITYQRKSTDTDNSHYMYFWGTERWNGASLFLTNLGRGGRTTTLLNKNRSDVFDRHPDLCIFEMPLANETVKGAETYSTIYSAYETYLNNFKSATNNFADTELVVILPHGRSAYFDGNRAVKYVSSGTAHTINHFMCKHLFNSVAGLLADYPTHTCCLDLMEQLYNEGLVRDYTIQGWLASSTIDVPTMTRDGIHLNTYGSEFWTKYLAGIFQ